ncbi:DNA-binding SARP family transcriptional activator/tetratricopeptide (TPR) repeat protein [Nocardia sp. GAS34]|uniref:AfsR/SARP family transcriptional regulator n=1 Tax=unclassified Nocardia TaxID=2637762 RepID=UPI003D199491
MLRFTVLGELRARSADTELELGPPQRRAVLAALLLHAGRTATVEQLVDAVWGDEPTASAVGALRNHVALLRRVGPAELLTSTAGGYRLRAPLGAVDVELAYEHLAAAEAHARDPEAARCELSAALRLWTGTPLSGVPGPFAAGQRGRFIELRLAVLEKRLAADMALGRHLEILPELSELVAEYPHRERFRVLHIEALHRAGRRAEGLEAYAATRRLLVDELGLEPGERLRALHAGILRGQGPASASGEAVVPAQLPADIGRFVGRAGPVAEITGHLIGDPGAGAPVAVISGMGGIGKSAVAVRVAHAVREHFTDGQLYVDLRGDSSLPADPAEVLGDLLRALGEVEGQIPAAAVQRAARLRGRLAGRRVLLVLDNARDAAQVAPLVPDTPGSAVLITSRSAMVDVPGARLTRLAMMTVAEARELFTVLVGERRVAAEPAAADRLVEASGQHPLALRILGARLAARPAWLLADIVDRLADERRVLSELRTGEMAIDTCFRMSYDQLDPAQATALGLLAVPDVGEVSIPAAAAILGCGPVEAERLCRSLVDLSLLESWHPGRYRLHDLTRLFGRRRADAGDVEPIRRVLDFYLAAVLELIRAAQPTSRLREYVARPHAADRALPDVTAAYRWLNAEHPNIIRIYRQIAAAPTRETIELAADLAWAMAELIDNGPYSQELAAALRALLDGAVAVGHRRGELRIRAALGAVLVFGIGHVSEALGQLRQVLDGGGDDARLAGFAASVATFCSTGEPQATIEYFELARRLAEQVGDQGLSAYVHCSAAKVLGDAGRYDDAAASAEEGTRLAHAIGHRATEATGYHERAAIASFQGEHERALELCERAVSLARECGTRVNEAWALGRLAQVHLLAGRLAAAEEAAAMAARLQAETAGPMPYGKLLVLLGIIRNAAGKADAAQQVFREAARIYTLLPGVDGNRQRVDENLEAPIAMILSGYIDEVLAEQA